MNFIKKECLNCTNQFNAPVREVNRGNGKFCCLDCARKYNSKHRLKPQPNVKCAYCDKAFYKGQYKKNKPKSSLHFCCREHKDLSQRIGGIKEIMPPHYGTGSPHTTYRRTVFITNNKPKICERCSYDKNEAAIVVHHKDRNRDNSDISNLEVLCCNCHAIEHWGD